jgi:hypothetical protein
MNSVSVVGPLIGVLAGLSVFVVLFLILPAFVLWYWKIDEQVSLLKEIRDGLRASRAVVETPPRHAPADVTADSLVLSAESRASRAAGSV